MISFRYHVFTIVAIFLAVALGIAVGNAYVQPALVRQLQDRTESLVSSNHDYRATVSEQEAEITQLTAAGDVLPVLDGHQLVDARVVVITQEGTDSTALSETLDALDEAQADVVAVLAATDRLMPADGQERSGLASVVGLPPSSAPEDLAARAADLLANRLAAGSRDVPEPAGRDILDELLRGQYLVPRGSMQARDLVTVGGRGEMFVVVSGSGDTLGLPPQSFAVPLVESLVRRRATVAAGEPFSTLDPFVEVLRGDATLDDSGLVTVDDLAYPAGGAALVLGLERVVGAAQGGDYGIRGDAEGPIPPPLP